MFCNDNDFPKPAYGGARVRIKIFLTEAVAFPPTYITAITNQLNTARKILRQHTLDLDAQSNQFHLLKFKDIVNPRHKMNPKENFAKLRDVVNLQLPDENRLIVVFAYMGDSGGATGYVVLAPDWLPWIVIDPRGGRGNITMMHEIGHACRCAHIDNSVMQEVLLGDDNFCNVHVHEIYRSYWCTGARPQGWWDFSKRGRGPYMWPPFDRPS